MPRIQPINRTTAPANTQKLLDGVEKNLGMMPNLIATMAQSSSLVQAYLSFSQALSGGAIPAQLREQIALAVGQANQCDYCLAAHSAIGTSLGLSQDEIHDARTATSPDRNTEAVLQFARRIVDTRGFVSDDDLEEIRSAGYGEPEIAELVGHVAFNIFANYFNLVAQTEVDFPPVSALVSS